MKKILNDGQIPTFYKFLVVSNIFLMLSVVGLSIFCISLENRLQAQKPQAQKMAEVKPPLPAPQVQKASDAVVIDRLLIQKSGRLMTAYSNGSVYKEYKIALGRVPEGKKEVEWDYKTPEGIYKIDFKKEHSQYHKALHISYPNEADIAYAATLGKKPGGGIYLHGLPNDVKVDIKIHWLNNWTWGCIAVTNTEIEELYELVKIGAEIEIKK